jgi:hypothetical protein
MKTIAGSSFMIAFNTWYYSFSPYVASYLQGHWVERTITEGALYPLIGILWLASATFNDFQSFPEVAALMSGLLASSLIGATYLGVPFAILEARTRRLRNSRRPKRGQQMLAATFLISLVGLGAGELLISAALLILSTVTIILSVILLSMITTADVLAKMLHGKSRR